MNAHVRTVIYHFDHVRDIFGRVMQVQNRTSLQFGLLAIGRWWLRQRKEVSEKDRLAAELGDMNAEECRLRAQDQGAVREPELGVFDKTTLLELGLQRVGR